MTSRWLRRGIRYPRGRVLKPASLDELFAPVVPIGEGAAALGWFVGKTQTGVPLVFTRGNEGFGANGLIYVYPDSDTVIIDLSHAGDRQDGTSYSRAVHAVIERLMFR